MEKELSYNKRQLKERPAIRQIAEQFLNEDLRKQLEPFIQYIEENKIPFSLGRCNTYESKYKTKLVFRVEIANGQACQKDIYKVKVYIADFNFNDKDTMIDRQNKLDCYLNKIGKEMTDYYLTHLPQCRGCSKCKPGITMDILGITKSGICVSDMSAMYVINPNDEDFAMIKRFIEARKQYILGNS